ncbi:uncharacterized protein LOC122385989 [Amphibalanus amphitrite]|uniref:uncharacterized protein LOC122385989 n=1 Tax=Amphibalanus amphitrite TaxID=1232801 RepID=UPI001C91C1E8|nr:uncharacterized protein LOC122385989 [Amphibalanus amphitrite]
MTLISGCTTGSLGRRWQSLLPLLMVTVVWLDTAAASEFPERECCDSIPPLPAQFTTPPVSVATEKPKTSSTSTTTTAKPTVISIRTASTTINCKLARELCEKDRVCHSITAIIPRLCGQELVSCSTVTVTKCRAALRTLVAFQFFQPTCLCKEQRVDPECNTYRNLVFDHPCFGMRSQDNDPYPVHALPTCDYALDACRNQEQCVPLYDNYLKACPFELDECHMTNSSACLDAWNQLKMSPVFGCMCTNVQEESCENIYEKVHKNPCIVSGLGGDEVTRPLAEHHLVAPLYEVTSQRPRSSDIVRTLYGPDEDEEPENPFAPPKLPETTKVDLVTVSSVDLESAEPVLQSSCHTALANCRRDRRCRLLLEPMLNSCVADSCHRQQCMKHMQEFYDQSDSVLVMDAALCVCRRRDAGESGCVAAMQRLHPACASQPEGGRLPSCLRVARHCRRQWDGRCRPRLERYEQACAVDVVTARCAGPSEHCRSALLAVLGTELHSHCGCHDAPAAGSTPGQHSCHDWERLLWANPCVVEAQREFHRQRSVLLEPILKEYGETVSPGGSPAESPSQNPARRVSDVTIITTTTTTTTTTPATAATTTTTTTAATTSTTSATTTSTTTAPRWPGVVRGAAPPPVRPPRPTSAAQPPLPAHCVSRREGRPLERIPVGSGIRYNRLEDDPDDPYRDEEDCSELCMCHGRGRLVCNVLDCLEKRECQSSLALYHHGTAGLVPYREGCVCHHGDFICMRPPADEYTLPFGVFLFLGYSRKEEEILHPYTHKTVKDHTITELKMLLLNTMREMGRDFQEWPCKLSIHQRFESTENLIVQAKLEEVEKMYNQSLSHDLLKREKDKCTGPLRDISYMINNRERSIVSHPLLSVFKMADVDVTTPDTSAAGPSPQSATVLLLLATLLAMGPPA